MIVRYFVILAAHVAAIKRTARIVLLAGVRKHHDEKDALSGYRCAVPGNGDGERKASYQVAMRPNRRIPP